MFTNSDFFTNYKKKKSIPTFLPYDFSHCVDALQYMLTSVDVQYCSFIFIYFTYTFIQIYLKKNLLFVCMFTVYRSCHVLPVELQEL